MQLVVEPIVTSHALATGAEPLLAAIATVEGLGNVGLTSANILTIGLGLGPHNVQLLQLSEASCASSRKLYVAALLLADTTLSDTASHGLPGDASTASIATHWLRCLACFLSRLVVKDAKPESKSVLVLAGEESTATSLGSYTITELKSHQEAFELMYCVVISQHFLTKLTIIRRFAYCVSIEHEVPSQERIPLETMRKYESDDPISLVIRWLTCLAVVSAGAGLPPGVSAGGAGSVRGYGVQWLTWTDAMSFINALYESRLKGGPLTSLCSSAVQSVCDLNRSLRISASAALLLGVSEVKRLASSYTLVASLHGGPRGAISEAGVKRPRTPNGKGPASDKKPAAEVARTPAGATPNGKPRKVGGNADGLPCRPWTKTGRCPGHSAAPGCCFSHAGPAGSGGGGSPKPTAAARVAALISAAEEE